MIDLSSFDVIEYLQEAGISYTESGKNVSRDWIGISCPYCGDQSNHCGINVKSKVFSCFRCGTKGRITKLIGELENKTFSSVQQTIKKFTKKEKYAHTQSGKEKIQSNGLVASLISEISEILCKRDGDYLVSRGFEPRSLADNYGILSCKPTSEYCQRILIPYNVSGRTLTFSSRDTSGKSKLKYKHCPVSQSVAAPKELLFGIDHATKDTCVVVEGCFDVFRVGFGAVALSGIQYTRKQVLVLSRFKRIFLLFDPETQAQESAVKLANDLSFCSASVEILKLDIDCDPGDMKEDDVKCLRKEIFGRIY